MKKQYWVSLSFIFILFSCVSSYSTADLSIEYYNIGNAYYELEDFEKAEKFYLKSLSLDSDFTKSRYNLIEVYMRLRKYSLAKESIKHLSGEDRDNLKVKKSLAYLYYLEGSLDKSLEVYLDIYASGDISVDLRVSIVKLYYQLEKLDESLTYLEGLVSDDYYKNNLEDKLSIYYLAGMIYQELGDLDSALIYFEERLGLGDDDLALNKRLYDIYKEILDFEKQKDVLENLIELDEDNIGEHYFELAYIYIANDNNYSDGYKYLKLAIENDFQGEDRANDLLKTPNLNGDEKIRQLFIDEGIIKK